MIFLVLILFIIPWKSNGTIFPSIPDYLLPCYRTDGPVLSSPYRMDVLLSTIRTLEQNTQLDLRLFSTSLLRSLRLDGIEQGSNAIESEFVTPYHASAFQFHKFKLMMDMFVPSLELTLVSDMQRILSTGETCMLHKMISSTVNSWERGDESWTCPEVRIERSSAVSLNSTRRRSRCPTENGVIQTDWGTISPGTIISAIAASLESQRVLVTNILDNEEFVNNIVDNEDMIEMARQGMDDATISNVWVATLAGDLAEVAVNQGPRIGLRTSKVVLGGMSRWNDTLLPRIHYMLNHTNGTGNWQFTDAEILAGIDGLIISHHLPQWIDERATLRLSQIIEMYYSNEGVTFDPTIKACNRRIMFEKILNQEDLIRETVNFAQVLSLQQGTVFIPLTEMSSICESVVSAFIEYYPSVLRRNDHPCGVDSDVPMMDMIVANDGSWRGYDVERFTSWLGDAGDVGLSGSSIGLLHGTTAEWIASPAFNLTTHYQFLRNHSDNWPTRMNFPNILSFLMRHLQNKTLEEAANQMSVVPSTVVLVVSPTDRLSETESERARDLMSTMRTTHFDIYFEYVAQDLSSFKNINSGNYDYSEFFLPVSSTRVEEIIAAVNKQIIVNQLPKAIIGAHCSFNGTVFHQLPYEDFVEPNKSNHYRIHPYYLQEQRLIVLTIRNNAQGILRICSWRGTEKASNCRIISERQSYSLNYTEPCPSPEFCTPAYIKVDGISSTFMCANNDCRFPHSIGYYIEHSGLRCLQLRSSADTIMLKVFYMLILLLLSTVPNFW